MTNAKWKRIEFIGSSVCAPERRVMVRIMPTCASKACWRRAGLSVRRNLVGVGVGGFAAAAGTAAASSFETKLATGGHFRAGDDTRDKEAAAPAVVATAEGRTCYVEQAELFCADLTACAATLCGRTGLLVGSDVVWPCPSGAMTRRMTLARQSEDWRSRVAGDGIAAVAAAT